MDSDKNDSVVFTPLIVAAAVPHAEEAATTMTTTRKPVRRRYLARFLDGPYVRSATGGAINGLFTTYTAICSGVGVKLEVKVVIMIGIGGLVGDAITLATSNGVAIDASRRNALLQFTRLLDRVREDRAGVIQKIHDELPLVTGVAPEHFAEQSSALELLSDMHLAQLLATREVDSAPMALLAVDAAGGTFGQLATEWLVTIIAFFIGGSAPLIGIYAGTVVFPGGLLGFNAGFALCSAFTLLLLAALGALNNLLVGGSALGGGLRWSLSIVPTAVAVFGLMLLFDTFLPAAMRNAVSCGDLVHYFFPAIER
jgi:hypothetical protein